MNASPKRSRGYLSNVTALIGRGATSSAVERAGGQVLAVRQVAADRLEAVEVDGAPEGPPDPAEEASLRRLHLLVGGRDEEEDVEHRVVHLGRRRREEGEPLL